MTHRFLLRCLLIVCSLSLPDAAYGGEGPTKEDVRWAYNYIHLHITGAGDVKVLPSVRQLDFPKDESYDAIEAITFNKPVNDSAYRFVKGVPASGFIVVRREYDRTDARWRGILIHELCHWIDYKSTPASTSCGCDPYIIQYIYYYETGLQDLIASDYNYMVHSPIRHCNINMNTLKILQAKGVHEQHSNQE